MKLNRADEMVSRELRGIADRLTAELKMITGQRMNFSLLVYNAEAGSRMNYISNVERESVVIALESLLSGWREGMPDIPAHKIDG